MPIGGHDWLPIDTAGFDAQGGRDDRGNRVPSFRVPDWLKDFVLYLWIARLLFGSAPTRQQPLQMRQTPFATTLLDQTEQGASSLDAVLPTLAQKLFKVPRRSPLQSCPLGSLHHLLFEAVNMLQLARRIRRPRSPGKNPIGGAAAC